jgi:hypothetical protein
MTLRKTNRIRLEPLGPSEEDNEEAAAWDAMMVALGITPEITTHDKGCRCLDTRCVRMLSVRRYVKAHINARRIRFSHKALQERLDDHVKDETERTVELDHAEALKMLETELPF